MKPSAVLRLRTASCDDVLAFTYPPASRMPVSDFRKQGVCDLLYLYLDESRDLGFDFVNKKPSMFFYDNHP